MTFTCDLETEGHVMVYVIFFISACIYPTAMNFMLFREVFRSRNSFQLSPFAWPSRVTLELKVTSRSTWLLLFLLVFVLPRWLFFCFVRFLVQGIHSNYCQLRDLHAWPWKPKVTSLSTWLFCFVRLLKHVDHDGTLRFKVTHDGHASGNSQNEFLDLKTWQNKKSLR